jgi:hypothetical protein
MAAILVRSLKAGSGWAISLLAVAGGRRYRVIKRMAITNKPRAKNTNPMPATVTIKP